MKRILILIAAMLLLFEMNVYAANGDLIVDGNLTVKESFNLLPAGTVVMFSGTTEPYGWVMADGRCLSKTGKYAALYAVIQDTYSSVAYSVANIPAPPCNSTEFRLPDFRGIFPKGNGTTLRTAGKDASDTPYTGNLGEYRQDQFQGHTHSFSQGNVAWDGAYPDAMKLNSEYDTHFIGPAVAYGYGTPRVGSTTEPQSLGVNFIIKY